MIQLSYHHDATASSSSCSNIHHNPMNSTTDAMTMTRSHNHRSWRRIKSIVSLTSSLTLTLWMILLLIVKNQIIMALTTIRRVAPTPRGTIRLLSPLTITTTTMRHSPSSSSSPLSATALMKEKGKDDDDSKTTMTPRSKRFRFPRRRGGIGATTNDEIIVPPLQYTRPRKICCMIEPTPFTHVSGYANRFQEMLRFMSQAGDDVQILTVDAKTPPSRLPLSFAGYPIQHTLGFTFPLYNHISLTLDLPELKGARLLEQHRPDLIHVTSPGFLVFAAMFYARVCKIPLVMSYHTHLPTYGKNYLGFIPRVEQICWDLLRYAHSRADLTLVTSPQMKEELVKHGIPRVEVWRKGIDTIRFHPSFRRDDMRHTISDGHPNDFVMIYVGRLGAEKRLKDIKPVLQAMPQARLCFVGDGPQKKELQEYYAGTNTVFTGQLSGDALSQAFASADVFIMPSDSETLGFVVLESMASGIPVVGAAAGGILDLIHDGIDGYLVKPGDTDHYIRVMKKVANDPILRQKMGVAARKEAEKWGWEAATSYLRNVQYEQALTNFHTQRSFGGYGRPGTASLFRLFSYRMKHLVRKYRATVATMQRCRCHLWTSLVLLPTRHVAQRVSHFFHQSSSSLWSLLFSRNQKKKRNPGNNDEQANTIAPQRP